MRETCLRITHGSRWVALDRSEVTLAIDESFAHRPVLTHVDESGVNDRLTVGVVVTRGVTANFRALDVLLARSEV